MIAVEIDRSVHAAVQPTASARHHLRVLAAAPGFRKLFGVRLSAQFADGVFQAGLAGAVLFSPERAANAADVAAGFAVLLLPYSIIGPFAGVLLDRWWRQRVLVAANLLRALAVTGVATEIALGLHGLPFYASALVVLSISRFFLAALSASLPHVVGRDELVTANALATTLGTLAATAGGGLAVGLRALIGDTDGAYALVAVTAVAPYLVSAMLAGRFTHTVLGPDDAERSRRETLAEVARGLRAGAQHLHSRRPAFLGLAMITVHRVCYGLWAVSTVLLYRNYFEPDGVFRAGLAGLVQLVIVLGVGGAIAAVVTPPVTRRIGFVAWTTLLLAGAAVVAVVFGLPYRLPTQLAGALLLAVAAQGIKISVDTLVQSTIDDEFRGRVFALYDTLFNLALVAAAVFTAVALPNNGHAPVAVVAIGLGYVATAIIFGRLSAGRADARRPRY